MSYIITPLFVLIMVHYLCYMHSISSTAEMGQILRKFTSLFQYKFQELNKVSLLQKKYLILDGVIIVLAVTPVIF
jgi:hypothetical protein